MKKFVADHPIWFAIIVFAADMVLGFLVSLLGLLGVPEEGLMMIALLVTTALPLGLIWWLGWWQDTGFVSTVKNVSVLWFPVVVMLVPVIVFGTVELEVGLIRFFLVALFLTGLSEEALSRGLLLRALLPLGKWYAVLIPAVLFGVGHITQFLFQGMPLADNLLQITFSMSFGIVYAALFLRTGNIWPLIVIHMLKDLFNGFGGIAGPGAPYTRPIGVDIVVAVLGVAYGIYILRKPITATIDGKAVE